MLINKETKKIKKDVDCVKCPYFVKAAKKCTGLNVKCFEYNDVLKVAIDGVTGLQIDITKL